MNCGAIVLAAGSSSRMGRSKQMLEINGEPLLIRTIRRVLEAGITPLCVVLGSEEKAHRRILEGLPVQVVHNRSWESGMGSSIKAGLLHLMSSHPSLEATLILVCDQPLLKPENIRNLLSTYEAHNKPIIASRYSGMPGVPALFTRAYFDQLAALPDDQGARKIILQNPDDVTEVDFPGGEVDLDTPGDYEAFRP